MKEQIRALKLDLKSIAKKIKNQKTVRKKSHTHHDKYEGDYSLLNLREMFRIKHVAYCLARGRILEQIDSGYKLDMEHVNWILKAMQPDSKEKLYVVVNENLTPSQQAVQSAHAVAEFLKENPNTVWRNGYLILLKAPPSSIGHMSASFTLRRYEFAEFREPDLGDKVTAYACFGPNVESFLKGYKLL